MIVFRHKVYRVAERAALVRATASDLSVPAMARPFVGAKAFLGGLSMVFKLVIGEIQVRVSGVTPQLIQVVQEPLTCLGALQGRLVQHLNLASSAVLHVVEAVNLLLALAVRLVHVLLNRALGVLLDELVV